MIGARPGSLVARTAVPPEPVVGAATGITRPADRV
jgi:hypothetical protein